VLLWGSVVECEHGWRASRAYPAEIFVPTPRRGGATASADEVAHGLAEYGVPLVAIPASPRQAVEELRADLPTR
jgi:hypothetical protein